MTIDALRFIVTSARRYGLIKVRLTGGEPLLHPDCHAMLRLLKCELRIPTVGFNTNAIRSEALFNMVSEHLLDDVVVGLDYADGPVSKDSVRGVPSATILKHILRLRDLGQSVSIACVYDGDCERLARLASWCIDNRVVLKILQLTTQDIDAEPSPEFAQMEQTIIERLSLQLGFLATSRAYYGMIDGIPRIYFFRSHCRLRECLLCSKIHVRVTADGYAKSCIQDDVKYPLLTGHFDESMLKLMATLGYSPEMKRALQVAPCE